MQRVVAKVRFILTQLQQAVKGEVVMTEELQETLYAVYDAKVSIARANRNACRGALRRVVFGLQTDFFLRGRLLNCIV